MNWLLKIQQILGVFWSEFFRSYGFIDGMKRLLWLMMSSGEGAQRLWMRSLFISPKISASRYGVYPIYIDSSSVCIKPATFTSVIHGDATFQDAQPISEHPEYSGQVVAESAYAIVPPDWVTDHAMDTGKTLMAGFDYTYDAEHGLFIFASRDYFKGLSKIAALNADGQLTFYYVLFGHVSKSATDNDSISGLISPELSRFAKEVWDVHINGASIYSMKKLIADVTECVICENDGILTIIGQEQGINWISVDGHIYGSYKVLNEEFTEGSYVHRGDILFGDMAVYTGNDTPSSTAVPGMLVQTDEGELIAPNSSAAWNILSGEKILPLVGNSDILEAYAERCLEIRSNASVPPLYDPEADTTVNPYVYVSHYWRNRRFCLVTVSTPDTKALDPALEEIRRSSPAEAMVNVFVKSPDEAMDSIDDMYAEGKMKVMFSADVCMAGVAESMTLKIKAEGAEATQLI